MISDIIKERQDESIYLSPEGLDKIVKNFDPSNPDKNVRWCTDYSV